MSALLQLGAVSKVYPMPGEDVHALRGVSLDIEAGEFLSIVGSSGSGKTTLLYLLGLLTDPTTGSYFFDGKDTGRFSDRERSALRGREIGFVFQAFHLLPQLTVLDNVVLSTRYGERQGSKRELVGRASELLERVGLGRRMRHRPRELSGGEMQRVAIARALLTSPRVLLADEPTGNLDDATGAQIFSLLEDLSAEGHTVILVTHESDLANRTQRLIRLKDGEVEHGVSAITA